MRYLKKIQDIIIQFLDWMYPPFARFLPRQMFRYAATGGANTLLDIILYAIVYTFILDGRMLHIGSIVISDHIAAFIIVFPFTFSFGFSMAKWVTFTNSPLKGRTQLLRYFASVMGALLLNYVLLKLLVEVIQINAVIANILNKIIVIAYSYFVQTYFSFSSKGAKLNCNNSQSE